MQAYPSIPPENFGVFPQSHTWQMRLRMLLEAEGYVAQMEADDAKRQQEAERLKNLGR